MYKGKRLMQRTYGKRFGLLLVSLVLLATVSVGGTLAYLVAEDEPVVNTFELQTVPNSIHEDGFGEGDSNQVKDNVQIRNDSEHASAYIRAAVVANWVKPDGEGGYNVYGKTLTENTDYEVKWRPDMDGAQDGCQNGWIKGEDGYHYFTKSVEAGALTDVLLTNCKVKDGVTPPEGCTLSVEIMAQSIQAGGEDADGNKPVVLAWGSERGGSVLSVNDDGTLSIQQ